MDRMASNRERVADEWATAMFQRTLSHWAADLLSSSKRIEWPDADPVADYRNRDWTQLYTGSVLDD